MFRCSLASLIVIFACSGCAHRPVDSDALVSLVDAERSFAAASAASGVRSAFLRYLHEDALLFRPGPVRGREYISSRPDPQVLLAWRPVRAEVSISGDLGYTSGPYALENLEHPGPAGRGFYVSLWKKEQDQAWKVILDFGTQDPIGTVCPEPGSLTTVPARGALGSAELTQILDLERRTAAAATAAGPEAGLAQQLAGDSFLLRDGNCPESDTAAIAVRYEASRASFAPLGGGMASSGDLAYVFGTRNDDARQGYYLRIWRRGSEASWSIVLDASTSGAG